MAVIFFLCLHINCATAADNHPTPGKAPELPANVEMVTDLQANNDLILANATQIHQVLINLVTNSAHAIGVNQGRIEIRLRNIELTQKNISIPVLMPGPCVEKTGLNQKNDPGSAKRISLSPWNLSHAEP
jgi:hypothetical protein